MSLTVENADPSSRLGVGKNIIIVAVKVSKEISKSALAWALTKVVKPGDCVKVLVVMPTHSPSKKLWDFPKFRGDCAASNWKSMLGTNLDQRDHITNLCNQVLHELKDIYDPDKVIVKMKIVHDSNGGVVASEAKKAQSQWVVLDKKMKKEANSCMEQLDCNVVVVKNCEPHVLRLNLTDHPTVMEMEAPRVSTQCTKILEDDYDTIKVPNVTPVSSPEHASLTAMIERISSISRVDSFTSPTCTSENNCGAQAKQILPLSLGGDCGYDGSNSISDSDYISSFSTSIGSMLYVEDLSSADEGSKSLRDSTHKVNCAATNDKNRDFCKNVRDIILFNKNLPSDPPPLCSVCQHKTPSFGKPPRVFSYIELEQATSKFSTENFLAEGGYGSVHRGVLSDGQVVAVKQHKLASTQGDREFCSEVQVLSCAQHRNVVMLIGYCLEDKKRLLVYEFACNGSLDSHLYGHIHHPLDWTARQKIAVGAARGLRYLHEECRVGCIVHRDMRPNNILLTHDFEPLVGDFGLARLRPQTDFRTETRIIGTFGYLAPEYAQTGQISEKADVYSFGVVLVELVTGRKAVDINRPKGQQCLTEWAYPLLEKDNISKLIDPCLNRDYPETEVLGMMHAALLCLQQDPQSRPRMSQVLRMLEGDA